MEGPLSLFTQLLFPLGGTGSRGACPAGPFSPGILQELLVSWWGPDGGWGLFREIALGCRWEAL